MLSRIWALSNALGDGFTEAGLSKPLSQAWNRMPAKLNGAWLPGDVDFAWRDYTRCLAQGQGLLELVAAF